MLEFQKYLISHRVTIKDALVAIDNLSSGVLTLFVVDDNQRMLGTLTDGDIRRKLISGYSINDNITVAMFTEFSFTTSCKVNINEIREFKNNGITLLPCLDDERHIVKVYNLKTQLSVLPIDAVLMAGGKGERLRPLTEKVPKPLLKVGEKSIIDYNVDTLISYGVENISVTVNFLKEQIEEHFENERNGVIIKCVCEPKYLGTIGSVKFVENLQNDTVLVMNSDLFTNINYEDFYLHFVNHGADMSVGAVPYSVNIPYGIFELEDREIKGVREKPTYNYYANAGIYLIKRKLLDMIPYDTFYNATDFIEALIKNGNKVIRFPLTGYWIDIGKHEDYKKAQELVKHL